MLSHYFEIKAVPHEEMPQSAITSLAMQDLHSLLKDFEGKVALAFPNYQKHVLTLGGRIRCFGDSASLEILRLKLSNKTISDYAIITNINPVATNIRGYYNYSRVQNKGLSDLRRQQRRLESEGVCEDRIKEILGNKAQNQKQITLPHVHIKSSSTGQQFLLMIKQKQKPMKSTGVFNSYGLSKDATVPWF